MKIKCTKEEYTRMVVQCALSIQKYERDASGCGRCILYDMCNKWDIANDDVGMYEWFLFLNDITEIVDSPTLE